MSAHQNLNSLLTRLNLACQMDDARQAWACLSVALGVPTGEMYKTMDAIITPTRWAEKSPADRHKDLVVYIDTILKRDPPPPADISKFQIPGFRIGVHQDRVCLTKYLPDGSKWRLFAHGPFLPRPGETITAQHLFDTYVDFEETYAPGDFILTDFLGKVTYSENNDDAFERALDNFVIGKKEMRGEDFGKLVGDGAWDDEDNKNIPVLVYQDAWWIDILPNGYALTLENQSWTSKPEDLRGLEKHLFSFTLI